MNDLNAWLKQRRAIHDAATEGPWVYTDYGVEAPEPPNPEDRFDMMAEVIARTELKHEDTNAIVDAHNTLPTLLTAVEKVLELHKPEEYEDPAGTFFCRTCGDWNMCEDPMGEQPDYPCPTVRAIEGAINE